MAKRLDSGPQQHDDEALVRALLRWFRANARDLPWRTRPLGERRDPYRVLVSEIMLQQTQASRVVDRFEAFVARFPSLERLASAPEPDVLAAWSGLGYYRRARLLHDAAKALVSERDGRFPRSASDLEALPGLGRYTAGAVASLSFHERVPAVDANVLRVVLRLEGTALAASDPVAATLAWSRAAEMHAAAPRSRPTPALLNESLIELGALVCTPRSPSCPECPVAAHCRARASGDQHRIPKPKARAARAPRYFASIVVRDQAGRLAVTRRPETGLWAGLDEAPTLERADRPSTTAEIRRHFGLPRSCGSLKRLTAFGFQTTHRDCRFEVFTADAPPSVPKDWRFVPRKEIATLAVSTPQRRVLLEIAAAEDH